MPGVGLAVQDGRMLMSEESSHERLEPKRSGREGPPAILAGQPLGRHFPDRAATAQAVRRGQWRRQGPAAGMHIRSYRPGQGDRLVPVRSLMQDGRQPITVDQPVGQAVDMWQAVLDRAGHGDRVPAEVAEAGAFDDQVLDRFLTRPAIYQFDSEPGAQMCALAGGKGLPGRRHLADLRIRPREAGQRAPDGLRLEPAVYAPLVPRLYDDGPGPQNL